MELAEIAIKEALSYKSSYISMMSNMHEELPDIHERVSNKGSDANNEGGDLCPLNSHILALDYSDGQDWQEPEYIMDEYCLKVNKQSTMEYEKSKDVSN